MHPPHNFYIIGKSSLTHITPLVELLSGNSKPESNVEQGHHQIINAVYSKRYM